MPDILDRGRSLKGLIGVLYKSDMLQAFRQPLIIRLADITIDLLL